MNVQDLRIEQRAAEGAKLLDDKMPGWEKNINLRTLDIGRYDTCMLHQVFGNYDLGLQKLNMKDAQEARPYGFEVVSSVRDGESQLFAELTGLQAAFTKEINARLAA